jgi:endoglucanase
MQITGNGGAARWKRGISLDQLFTWPPLISRDPPAYAWPPFDEDRYRIADTDLARLKAIGFDFIRLPVDPAIFLSEAAPDKRAVLNDRLREHIQRIRAQGLGLIVDLHASNQNPAFPAESMAGAGPLGEKHLQAYAALVGDIAALLAPFPDVGFELINEPALPHDDGDWSGNLKVLYDAARRAAPDSRLVISGANYGRARELIHLDPGPYIAHDTVFTFHAYEPTAFTSQGTNDDRQPVAGLPWPAAAGSMDQSLAASRARLDEEALEPGMRERAWNAVHDLVHTYFFQDWGQANIDQEFDAVAGWAKTAGIAPDRVLLGEFGAGHAAGDEGRARWLRAMREAAEQRGFGWALWAYAAGDMALAGPDGDFDTVTLEALGLALA